MQVTILPFGILKESLGPAAFPLTLAEDATVSDLLANLSARTTLRGIAVSVNAEYAQPSQPLNEGDEVGLLPPVSGGTAHPAGEEREADTIYLTNEVIPSDQLIAAAKAATDGAVLTFDGIVRNHSRNRETVYLDYEAYEEMALKQMRELAAQAREKFAIRHVTIVHRLGRLAVGETSVLIIVASGHRPAAYEASRFLIDTLKKTVPIWKKEIFTDGAVWADGDPFPESLAIPAPEAERA
jgi:molybdopterin synthase catalytic subunit